MFLHGWWSRTDEEQHIAAAVIAACRPLGFDTHPRHVAICFWFAVEFGLQLVWNAVFSFSLYLLLFCAECDGQQLTESLYSWNVWYVFHVDEFSFFYCAFGCQMYSDVFGLICSSMSLQHAISRFMSTGNRERASRMVSHRCWIFARSVRF